MAKREHEMSVPDRMTLMIHNAFLARYAEHKLGLAIVTPEEPEDPEEQPGPCLQCGARAVEWGADCLPLELAIEHMLPTDHSVSDEDAGKPIHFRCWDVFRATLGEAAQ